jgi:DNA-binding transcriptional LysR family regulator
MSRGIELRHLRGLVAVADELNFSRAARKLHMVQQSLSAQVQQLESELGVQLFRRTTRRVELSEAGEVLVAHARSILGLVAAACDQTRRTAAGESGELTVSYTPTLANETLPRLVAEVHARYPGLTLQMCEMWQTESVDAVRSGRVDVGMARFPEMHDDELECIRLREEPIGIVLGAGHPLAGLPRVDMGDLAQTTLAIWPRRFSPGFYDQVVDSFRSHGFHGRIQEFEYLTSALFNNDPVARADMADGRAFSVAFATQFNPLPEGFVWKELHPVTLIPVHLFWRRGAAAAAESFLAAALAASASEGWLDPIGNRA